MSTTRAEVPADRHTSYPWVSLCGFSVFLHRGGKTLRLLYWGMLEGTPQYPSGRLAQPGVCSKLAVALDPGCAGKALPFDGKVMRVWSENVHSGAPGHRFGNLMSRLQMAGRPLGHRGWDPAATSLSALGLSGHQFIAELSEQGLVRVTVVWSAWI